MGAEGAQATKKQSSREARSPWARQLCPQALNKAMEKKLEHRPWALEVITDFGILHKLEATDVRSPPIFAEDIFVSSVCKGRITKTQG